MKYDLKRPCDNCPFRRDSLEGWLGRARAQEIAESLDDRIGHHGGTFACHKTTGASWEEDDEGEQMYTPKPTEQHCAGALIVLAKADVPNQMSRLAERFGWFDPDQLDMSAPVFDNFEQFADHHDRGGPRGSKPRSLFEQFFGRPPMEDDDDEDGDEDGDVIVKNADEDDDP